MNLNTIKFNTFFLNILNNTYNFDANFKIGPNIIVT